MLMLRYFGHPRQRADSSGKTLILGKTEDQRSGQQRVRRLDGITDSVDTSKLRETVKGRAAWRAAVLGVPENQTRLSN